MLYGGARIDSATVHGHYLMFLHLASPGSNSRRLYGPHTANKHAEILTVTASDRSGEIYKRKLLDWFDWVTVFERNFDFKKGHVEYDNSSS